MTDGLRPCAICGHRKAPASFYAENGQTCKTCKADAASAWKRVNRAAILAKAHAIREALNAQRASARARRGEPSRFDATRTALERAWGPYGRWTREQHAQHTTVLRRAAGMTMDAPTVSPVGGA